MAQNPGVRVVGATELAREFDRKPQVTEREIRAELKTEAERIAKRAREIARDKGLVATGALVRGIRAEVDPSGTTAVVASTATNPSDGFNYPLVFEVARGMSSTPPRANLIPAFKEAGQDVHDALADALARAIRKR